MGSDKINLINYSKDIFENKTDISIEDCAVSHSFEGKTWIDIDSTDNVSNVKEIAANYHFHPLMLENILNPKQRPKYEDFDHQIFIFLKLISINNELETLETENISIVFDSKIVITFQGNVEGDVYDEVRKKLGTAQNKVRKSNTDFLVYELLEATIESYFKIIEDLGEKIEDLETTIMSRPDSLALRKIYKLKRNMMFLRKTIWPMREILNNMLRTDNDLVCESSKIYLRDVYEHCTQLLDHIEIHREMLAGLLDIYLSSISYRMNAVMKVLTVISTIFIPLTFITSIYGMNFEVMPELKWRFGYTMVWVIVLAVTVGMLYYFKKKKWF